MKIYLIKLNKIYEKNSIKFDNSVELEKTRLNFFLQNLIHTIAHKVANKNDFKIIYLYFLRRSFFFK